MRNIYLLLAYCILTIPYVQAEQTKSTLRLASVFSDHMVLQRQMPIPVWGTGDPGDSLSISVADQRAETQVDGSGRWSVNLPELSAGGPYTMEVKGGKAFLEIRDVLVGEVWIAAGQSNMQMGYQSLKNGKQVFAEASKLPVRALMVPRMVHDEPRQNMSGKWRAKPCESAVALTFALDLQKSLDVPVAVIEASWGSSSLEGWMPISFTERFPHFKKMMENYRKHDQKIVHALLEKEKRTGKRGRQDDIFLRTRPNILYNAMMAPLVPYACRGLIWYQGEANATSLGSMRQYGESLPAWVQHLRKQWGREDFHFLAVMLPQFGKIAGGPNKNIQAPDAHSWAWFREAQLKVLTLPHTGVANTIDLGNVKNIHPTDKGPIGKRLSLLAQQSIRGRSVEASGPLFDRMAKKGPSSVSLYFKHAKGLTTRDGEAPRGFWLGDKEGNWKSAQAHIEDASVVLEYDAQFKPQYIRYAFAAAPDVNLVNAAGLPAMPFRTDQIEPPGYRDEAQEPGAKWRRK